MRYGIAIWNYLEPDACVPDVVAEFVGFGFDAVSLQVQQITGLDASARRDLDSLLDERSLAATIHGDFRVDRMALRDAVAFLGTRLYAVSFDADMTLDSLGARYDAAGMARTLAELDARTTGASFHFGIEDFPLDRAALEHYRDDLVLLLERDCFGMLIDVGHLNLRCRREAYFQSLRPQEYLERLPLPVFEVHVHDNDGQGDCHAPIGTGNAPFEQVAEGLRDIGFDVVSTIEIAPSFHGSTPAESKPRARESLAAWRALWEASSA